MTDPSPRAGFTVGSLAEVERSLLPLPPSSPYSSTPLNNQGFSHSISSGSILLSSPCRLLGAHRVPRVHVLFYHWYFIPLLPVSLSLSIVRFAIYRSAFSPSRGQRPRRSYLRKPARRREQLFAPWTTLESSPHTRYTRIMLYTYTRVHHINGY